MTVHQMVCHLCDALRLVTGEKSVRRTAALHERTVIKWIALYAPLRWPPGIVTTPEMDQELGGTHPDDFAIDVARLETLLEIVTTQTGIFRGRRHPIFGAMSDAAWLRWGYLHMDHHLRQFGA